MRRTWARSVGSRAAVAVLGVALLVSACATSEEPPAASPDTSPIVEATPSPPPEDGADEDVSDPGTAAGPEPTASPDPADLRVARETVVEGLTVPLQSFVFEGRTMVVQQDGRIVELRDDGRVEEWLDLRDLVVFSGERGLLGADVLPSGEHLVVHYSRRSDGATQLATVPIGPDGAPERDGLTVVFEASQPAGNHNGGTVVVQPDGLVLLALGDGGGAGDRYRQGQDTDTPLGAILRLDLADPSQARVPPANPFADGSGAEEIWLHGLRNPYRIALGDGQAYIVDVGQDAQEELTVVPLDQLGGNLGWPLVEGDLCFEVDPCDDLDVELEPADVTWDHADGACSGVTGLVYAGEALPALRGHLLYGDLCTGFLRTARAEDGVVVDQYDLTEQVGRTDGLLATGPDADGEPLLLFGDGRVERLVPAG